MDWELELHFVLPTFLARGPLIYAHHATQVLSVILDLPNAHRVRLESINLLRSSVESHLLFVRIVVRVSFQKLERMIFLDVHRAYLARFLRQEPHIVKLLLLDRSPIQPAQELFSVMRVPFLLEVKRFVIHVFSDQPSVRLELLDVFRVWFVLPVIIKTARALWLPILNVENVHQANSVPMAWLALIVCLERIQWVKDLHFAQLQDLDTKLTRQRQELRNVLLTHSHSAQLMSALLASMVDTVTLVPHPVTIARQGNFTIPLATLVRTVRVGNTPFPAHHQLMNAKNVQLDILVYRMIFSVALDFVHLVLQGRFLQMIIHLAWIAKLENLAGSLLLFVSLVRQAKSRRPKELKIVALVLLAVTRLMMGHLVVSVYLESIAEKNLMTARCVKRANLAISLVVKTARIVLQINNPLMREQNANAKMILFQLDSAM
jgi:hypothetical protein